MSSKASRCAKISPSRAINISTTKRNDRCNVERLNVQTFKRGTHMLKTQELQINIGPQHPSTHGVFRLIVTVDGETIIDLKPVFGYLHRNHEQLAEVSTYIQSMPYTDRLPHVQPRAHTL